MGSVRKHTQRRFDELKKGLFQDGKFQKEVTQFRKSIGIPTGGFTSNKAFQAWFKKAKKKDSWIFMTIREKSVDLSNKYKLPHHLSGVIEARIIMGHHYESYDMTSPYPSYSRGFENAGYSCAWEIEEGNGCVVIKVYAGATSKDIKHFVDRNFREMKKTLSSFSGNQLKATREKKNSQRDREIVSLHKQKLIRSSGIIPLDEKIRVQIPDSIKNMTIEARKSVIIRRGSK